MGLHALYEVRPHACASIFHSSPCFENVYARVPVRAAVWPLIVTAERPGNDRIRIGAFHIPEPHFVRHVLVRDPKVVTPLFYVSKPIGRSIRVQPAVGRDAVNDDGVIPENAEEKLDVLGVETVNVIYR